jgi:chromosome transmission fidelity protein 18
MMALCEKTGNDIRSSINTLQFLSKRTKRIDTKLIQKLSIGQKDTEKGFYTIMNEIFSKKMTKSLDGNKFFTIISMCQNCDLQKMLQGLYENLLQLRYRDNHFELVEKANEWFMFTDAQSTLSRHQQDFSLLKYQIYLPTLFHVYSSSVSLAQNQKFKYPMVQYENFVKFNKNLKIQTQFLSEMLPSVRTAYNSAMFVIIDLIPFLNQILQPNIRPVAIQLLSKSEKEKFDNLIKIMIAFNLNYRQEKGADGQFTFVLEPAIDELIKLKGLKQHKQICYIIKQQMSRELTVEKLKLAELSKCKNDTTATGNGAKSNLFKKSLQPASKPLTSAGFLAARTETPPAKRILPLLAENKKISNGSPIFSMNNYLKRSNPNRGLKEKEKAENIEAQKLKTDVWLKFKEGYINAVRYNIKINQLL